MCVTVKHGKYERLFIRRFENIPSIILVSLALEAKEYLQSQSKREITELKYQVFAAFVGSEQD